MWMAIDLLPWQQRSAKPWNGAFLFSIQIIYLHLNYSLVLSLAIQRHCALAQLRMLFLIFCKGAPLFSDVFSMRLKLLILSNTVLFQKLLERGLPTVVVRFLFRWYSQQKLKVCWGNTHSSVFGVSNGVRQGGVLSPILFSIYLDMLLLALKESRIGCTLGGV